MLSENFMSRSLFSCRADFGLCCGVQNGAGTVELLELLGFFFHFNSVLLSLTD